MTKMFALSKNHYEEIIDNEMLDLIVEKYQLSDDEKKKIKGVSVEKKRLAILSFLDENRGLYKEITRMINTKNVSESTHIDEVVTMLRTYVKVSDVEKKTLGEVMTPLELVEDILNTLPEDVWSNPSLRWLDPCNGVGVFPSMVVQRLMSGLATAIPNEERRYKHIIENMLYVCELQPKNMFLFQCAFDPQDKYFLNTYVGSFLSENFTHHAHNLWGVDKFDIIIGNPPYQTSNEGEKKTHSIWQKFVQNSFEHLVEGGYLAMVHPDGWRNIDGMFKDTQKIMTSRQVLYLELHSTKDGFNTFGANTNYDFYCIKNEPNNGI
jgi:type I restriction-modification system DNA methylase subunit